MRFFQILNKAKHSIRITREKPIQLDHSLWKKQTCEDKKKLLKEISAINKKAEQLKEAGSDVRESVEVVTAMERIAMFLEKVGDGSKRIGKAMRELEDGAEWAGKLIDRYNQFAPWFTFPVIPNIFKKNKS